MGVKELSSDALNEQQVLMLRLLKKPLPEADFAEIRRLAVKLLSRRLDQTVDDWENKENITEQSYDELSKSHFRGPSKKH
ncbi:hypothetical protein [Mucilaginibacter sp. SG564]|uniref:hypothetical protein n=1 Tax=unclassified Mucilaginibacter TaxID=2617802 RepID=UPI0015579822|nr:hypothetical protein [Mucilaginibacter sp. SG564]NOW98556.1 hypothetical protein [Mucilaginibacter sp. SG564]